ncbi:TrkH family potassium uptake protein [Desulfoscipio gibsoniae]|uniref:Trk-type K+ transport system, membrane component n=1 Tax=Desulfoscipio gibsoniae DSM 7213 TaxID=767817 RepID=R4KPI3_9FIRM|nr:potassium transporter TrkG [Desulfoscipio gibsoniae]AGL01546.1 Trk-type K+ transport system, membrane component [Desulfoscipio gibsoniae DSM 7213]
MYKKLKPGQLLLISYALVDLVGTLLLLLPIASTEPGPANLVQAWFTATSALTVTGLTVVTTATHWTMFGHMVIMILIQIGGLGLMALATIILAMLGLRIHLGHRLLVVQDRNYFSMSGVIRLVLNIFLLTLVLESIGAVILAFLFPGVWDNGLIEGLLFVVFHAVSAFNGAGFDLTGQSLEPFRDYLGINLVMIALIILGSLGFVVLQELFLVRKWHRLSLHSRMVLLVTGAVTLLGSIFFLASEYNHTLAGAPPEDKIVISLFQAATRTAGFTTVPIMSWSEPFIFLMIIMMFIGASPGSVGGGIKTTTFGTVVLAVWSIVRGKKAVVLFEREIAPESVTKAFTVVVMAGMLVAIITLLLMIVEGLPLVPVLFEVVSAMATVGLSTGITSHLSPFGMALIGLVMFVGRIGVLTVVVVLAGKEKRRSHYMKEDILIG